MISALRIIAKQLYFTIQLANGQSGCCSETRTNLTSELRLKDSLLTDQLTKRSRNWLLMYHANMTLFLVIYCNFNYVR